MNTASSQQEVADLWNQLLQDDPAMLEVITERERKVLELRFGLVDGKSRTLAEVASEVGLSSRERVRQIEAKGIRKLASRHRFTRNLSQLS